MICGRLTYASFVLTILFLALVQTALSQNYHFSNGWYPGKKRSANANPPSSDSNNGAGSRRRSSSYGLVDESCNIRPDAVLFINRIVQDEITRIQRSCIPEMPSGLVETLENAASPMESDSKW